MQRKGPHEFIDRRSTLHLLLRGKSGADLEGGRGVPGDVEHLGPGHVGLHLLLRGGIGLTGQPQRLAGLGRVGGEGSHVEDQHTGLLSRADRDPARLQKARHGMVVAEPRLADKHIDAARGQIDVTRRGRSCSRSGRQLRRLSSRRCRSGRGQEAQCYQGKGCSVWVVHGIAPALHTKENRTKS